MQSHRPGAHLGNDHRVSVPWDKTIIYETHVRGISMRHPSVPENVRGTFAGLMVDDVLEHIRKLGVSSVELLPIHAFVNDQHLLHKGMTNYWGYNSIAFFAPTRAIWPAARSPSSRRWSRTCTRPIWK